MVKATVAEVTERQSERNGAPFWRVLLVNQDGTRTVTYCFDAAVAAALRPGAEVVAELARNGSAKFPKLVKAEPVAPGEPVAAALSAKDASIVRMSALKSAIDALALAGGPVTLDDVLHAADRLYAWLVSA